MSTQKHDR